MTTASPLLETLVPVVEALERLEVGYFIGGSIASAAHGVGRSTLDADIVADMKAEHVVPFVRALSASYYLDEARVRSAVDQRRTFNVIHLATMLKVDVFVLKQRAFERSELGRAVEAVLGDDPPRTFRFATAEDIVLAKLEWFRAGGEVSERQWFDVLGVVRVKAGAFDWDYVDAWARALGVSDLVDKVKEQTKGG